MRRFQRKNGFTLIEVLVVIFIIGFLFISAILVLRNVLGKGGDAARKAEVVQIGKVLTMGCYLPDAGSGEYDLVTLLNEIFTKKPQFKDYIRRIPKDPKAGSEARSGYTYIVSADGKNCALYANLENKNEPITLRNLARPTPGGGAGTLRGDRFGLNGTQIYFQVSN